MVRFPAADNRHFTGVYICMRCNGKQRSPSGKAPAKCRKCGAKRFRLKSKAKKA